MRLALLALVYSGAVVLMYRRRLNTLIGLPVLALLTGLIAGIPAEGLLKDVITDGALRLHNPIIVILFGAALAEIVKRTGLVEVLIRNTAEFLGDRTTLIATFLMLIIAVLFTVLSGLGAIVMVGSVVFPILISLGISKLLAGCIFLFGLSLGGMLNLFNWSLYSDVLKLSQSEIFHYVLRFFPLALLVSVAFLFIEIRREGGSSFKLALPTDDPRPKLPFLVFLTPLVPVALLFGSKLIYGYDFPIIAAMFAGIVWGTLFAPRAAGSKAQLLTRSMVDGVSSVAPAIVLMVGIGMLLKAVAHPQVSALLLPTLQGVMPTSALGYVGFFTLLAPLALYRGPLNIWGMGSGLVALMKDTGSLPAAAIMAALLSVGQIQGISDPTNTYNVWIANYLGVDVVKILRKTLLYAWLMALLGLGLAAALYY